MVHALAQSDAYTLAEKKRVDHHVKMRLKDDGYQQISYVANYEGDGMLPALYKKILGDDQYITAQIDRSDFLFRPDGVIEFTTWQKSNVMSKNFNPIHNENVPIADFISGYGRKPILRFIKETPYLLGKLIHG